MDIIKEDKYTMILSSDELRIIYTAMDDYSKDKSSIERKIAEDMYCALI